jgi:hypothetical protein
MEYSYIYIAYYPIQVPIRIAKCLGRTRRIQHSNLNNGVPNHNQHFEGILEPYYLAFNDLAVLVWSL